MHYIDNILFALLVVFGVGWFVKNMLHIRSIILKGKGEFPTDNRSERWKLMARIALGQGKMTKKPIAGILHIIVYIGFILINLELLEIVIDGIFGTHRYLHGILGDKSYSAFTYSLEVLALLVVIAVVAFLVRRNVLPILRFRSSDLNGWPRKDANWILIFELVLMFAFLLMNGADHFIQEQTQVKMGSFPVSSHLFGFLNGLPVENLHLLERFGWWLHIIGVVAFMNYLYYSKHLHIIFAFPAVFYAKLQPKGKFSNMDAVTKEVKLMLGLPVDEQENPPVERFGAADVTDLHKTYLLQAYACTECGRCTAVCPANLTGKKLSPRKIMMAVRDRCEDLFRRKLPDAENKKLLDDYITREELWACTTCNACVEACPVLLNPMEIILEMRRFLVLEESAAPQELNLMLTNMENNAAPWQFNPLDRANWTKE